MANNIERDVYTKADGIKIPIDYLQNTNAIPIIFHFRDFQIPAGATAQVFVQKPSGLAVYNAATISGNDVTVDVTTQMMAEVGFNKLQIQVMSGEDNLVTFVQPVNVRQNYTDGESEESKNESNLFDELQEAAQAANTAAEAANSAAEDIEAKAEAGDFSSTVTVGSTTTGEPGSQASVTNSGTAQNPVLDFVIPTGAQGPQGPKGDPGSAEDIDTTPVTFEQASTRENVASGDTVSTLFGKISKWFSDLGTAAFKGVSNVLTQTSDGYVLDARQGNVLSTMIGVLDNLVTTAKTNLVAAINECSMEIGNLTALTTDEKTDLVSAINETNAGLTDLNDKLPVVLYDNDDTPEKGAITLSDSAANYSRLTILYKNNDEFYGSTDVYSPDGKKVALLNFSFGDITTEDPVYLKFRTILISGNTINTAQDASGAYLTGEQRLSEGRHYTKGDFIAITQVLGYRG